jgi:hypothetical protein
MVRLALSRFALLPLALALLLALPVGPVFAEPTSDDLVRESVDRLGLQTEMPAPIARWGAEMPDPTMGSRTEMPDRNLAPRTGMPEQKSEPQAEMPNPAVTAPDHGDHGSTSRDAPGFIRVLLWATVIVGTLVIAWSLRDSLPVIGRSRKIVAPERAPAQPAASKRMDAAQVEADDLARQGRYGEAMHVLLLKSLGEIRRQLGTSFAISLTSREILRRVQLPDIGQKSLTAIIRSVERTYFGGKDAGQSDYSDCRSHFETLKHSLATVAAT